MKKHPMGGCNQFGKSCNHIIEGDTMEPQTETREQAANRRIDELLTSCRDLAETNRALRLELSELREGVEAVAKTVDNIRDL